jgi:hypothetical protein
LTIVIPSALMAFVGETAVADPKAAVDKAVSRRGAPTAVGFAWGTPCRVPVTEVTLKKGVTTKMTYEVVLEPAARGSELRLRMEHFDFLEVNGLDVTTPAMRSRLAEAVVLTAAIPAMRIAKNGTYLGVVDLEKAVAWMLEQPPFNKDPAQAKQVRTMMLSPQMLEILRGKMGEIWQTWVGAWLAGGGLSPGDTAELNETVGFGARNIVAPAKISHLGEIAGVPGVMRFRFESDVRGKGLISIARGFLVGLLMEMGVKEPPELQIAEGSRQELAEVDTEPSTLRPHRALFETKLYLMLRNGKDTRYHERRETTFHWEKAQGVCARKT